VTADAVTKICHRFIGTSTLHLVVGSFIRLALGARQDTLVLCIHLRLGHLHRRLLLSNLSLSLTLGSFGPHLSRCQRLQLFGLHLLDHIGVVFEIEEHTEKSLLVPQAEQFVFPRRHFQLVVLVFVQNYILFCVCHRPVVHRELGVSWLDALARIQLLKLLAGVITKSMFSRHFG